MNHQIGETEKLLLSESFVRAACASEKVSDTPHNFYRYPARFSPLFAREAIRAFSSPGDLVLDPFCGGGTSIVEAVRLGRHAVGFDVSSLASFLSRTKTSPLSSRDVHVIRSWANELFLDEPVSLDTAESSYDVEYYERNLSERARLFFRWVIAWLELLENDRQRNFVRLILLGVGQWALDCKAVELGADKLKAEFCNRLTAALPDFYEYLTEISDKNSIPRCRIRSLRRVINRSAEESGNDARIPKSWLPAKLVLTSPPYPGVHMLYHRWQINGRRETPIPFLLANQRDGAGESFYCLGSRNESGLQTYFVRLKAVFESILPLIDHKTLVVQLVAFSEPDWQLPTYLQTLTAAGFEEVSLSNDGPEVIERRLWRNVPSRKWYAMTKGKIPASKEVLLIHRLSSLARRGV